VRPSGAGAFDNPGVTRRRPLNALAILCIVAALAASCGGGGAAPPTDPLNGNFLASGGGGALAQMAALTKRFSELHPRVKFENENVGSDAAVPLVVTGQVDLGFVSRELTADERSQIASLSIGVTGTGVAVNAANPIKGLTREEVRQIYTGELKDWSAVGGPPGPIKVITREVSAATRQNFEEGIFGKTKPVYLAGLITAGSNAEMIDDLSGFVGGIGVLTVSSRAIDPRVKLISLDGVEPTTENVLNGTFPIRRPLFLVYPKDPAKMKPAVSAFVDFVRSPEGQKILASF
jgi:phosphate transport system substrate-binding protein